MIKASGRAVRRFAQAIACLALPIYHLYRWISWILCAGRAAINLKWYNGDRKAHVKFSLLIMTSQTMEVLPVLWGRRKYGARSCCLQLSPAVHRASVARRLPLHWTEAARRIVRLLVDADADTTIGWLLIMVSYLFMDICWHLYAGRLFLVIIAAACQIIYFTVLNI